MNELYELANWASWEAADLRDLLKNGGLSALDEEDLEEAHRLASNLFSFAESLRDAVNYYAEAKRGRI